MKNLYNNIMSTADAAVAAAYPAALDVPMDPSAQVVANAASAAAFEIEYNGDKIFNAAIYLITAYSINNKKRKGRLKELAQKL